MFGISKKILITTKRSEIFVIRRSQNKLIKSFCKDCEREVFMLTLDEAVDETGSSVRELIRLIDAGAVHSVETESGHLLVCRNSLKLDGEIG